MKKVVTKGAQRITAAFMSAVLVFMLCIPTHVSADNSVNPSCGHHTQHDAACGYAEAQPCAHVCDANCYQTTESCAHVHTEECKSGENCSHVCSEKSGCITRILNCSHVHDEQCGYAEAKECGYVCEICSQGTTEENEEGNKNQGKDKESGSTDSSEENKAGSTDTSKEDNTGNTDASKEDTTGTDTSKENNVGSTDTSKEAEVVMQLYIDHVLTLENGHRYVDHPTEPIDLTAADFTNGVYNFRKHAYDHEALIPSPGKGWPNYGMWTISQKYGEKECFITIEYTLKEGWKAIEPEKASGTPVFRSIYEGNFNEVTFEPVGGITVTIRYEYSPTGGLADVRAHDPDVIKLRTDENGKADLTNWKVPHFIAADAGNPAQNEQLEGFRTVLDSAPLNALLISPPTGNESQEEIIAALRRGDYNLRDDVTNQELQSAWDNARTITVKDKKGNDACFTFTAPAENEGTDATTSTDPEKQHTLTALGLTADVDLTIYYRRDTSTYTVKHWLALKGVQSDPNVAEDWEQYIEDGVDGEIFSGRVGALTEANAKDIPEYQARAITQEPISADGSTVINVYYIPEYGNIRIVFNIDDCDNDSPSFPRQEKEPGEVVTMPDDIPKRNGYTFTGWKYVTENGSWKRIEDAGADVYHKTGSVETVTLTEGFLEEVSLQDSVETTGVRVIMLYPDWETDKTIVRVVFWTENLTGRDDVSFEQDGQVQGTVKTHRYKENAFYNNMGSLLIENVRTDSGLSVQNGTLYYTGVNENGSSTSKNMELKTELGKMDTMSLTGIPGFSENNSSKFYSYDNCAITRDSKASADGSTVVNVYFTRNVYELQFIYSRTDGSHTYIAEHTHGYANNGPDQHTGNANRFATVTADALANVPKDITIRAKYGADLKDVWPYETHVVQANFNQLSMNINGGNFTFISWTPTSGPYNTAFKTGISNEPTILGVYACMGAEIISNPDNPTAVNKMYAYWTYLTPSYYRYNHCYEIPGLTAADLADAETVSLANGSTSLQDTLYLVPDSEDNAAARQIKYYGFTDLMQVGYSPENGVIYPGKNGILQGSSEKYYLIRGYETGANDISYYALSRQVPVASTNNIIAQNPSSRLHLTRANGLADHSSMHEDGDGGYRNSYGGTEKDGEPIGSFNDPYDLYFYYNRDRYSIYYETDGSNILGSVELPYGALLSSALNVILHSTNTEDGEKTGSVNGEYANDDPYKGWQLPYVEGVKLGNLPVCPGRNPNGTMDWTFTGWYLDSNASTIMSWDDTIIDSNLRLYPGWAAPSYTVIFDLAGGSVPPDEEQYLTQEIAANQSILTGGTTIQPTRGGCYLEGWQITHYQTVSQVEGNQNKSPEEWEWTELDENSATPFLFTDYFWTNVKVKAVWDAHGARDIWYQVRYVTEHPLNGSRERLVDVAPPAVLNGTFVPGANVYARAIAPGSGSKYAAYKNYIPRTQNGSVVLKDINSKEEADQNTIYIYYDPPISYQYTVLYKLYENGAQNGKLILSANKTTTLAQLSVFPEEADVRKIQELGYYLVDENGNRAKNAGSLTQSLTMSGTRTVTFYVSLETYTITYTNLKEVIGNAAYAKLKLPKTYTTETGAGHLNVPKGKYNYKGTKRTFRGWKMVPNLTSQISGTDFRKGKKVSKNVNIDAGSRGNLYFEAVWTSDTHADKDKNTSPPQVGSGDGSGSIDRTGLPQTGLLWWPVLPLFASGLLLLWLAGLEQKKRRYLLIRSKGKES